ncbi:alpha/beta fold hydrolase [Nocardia huaxiensis]|uniref:Alpha/beta hydrolase n=1 Tax=Nocardia huaxiensis TaxID=2755382 RepID=A0A7D6V6X4_9NOCA|nr:alpha/beta hydrolase [Nocardia huaxiensis]QLY28154.1 alpha/beta hydrolase [Nocardia huaxiensis]UFS98400.1 alpha/beta hydrolase [Nocardia huaxiensis]
MPIATLNGIGISYEVTGNGPLVVLVMGSGSPGRVWRTYQVPALVKAGFRVATFDNRGIAPSDESVGGMTLDDLAADTAALIEHLGGGPAHVVGHSMGARVVQELALARPDLLGKAIMLGAVGRAHPLAQMYNAGEQALYDKGIQLPPEYAAAIKAMLNLSPHTVEDPARAQEWLDIFEYSAGSRPAPGVRAQLGMDRSQNRLPAYANIKVPSLVVGFTDDKMTPPAFGREVAAAIPNARYVEIERCGHYGYLERPEEVNRTIIEFLTAANT